MVCSKCIEAHGSERLTPHEVLGLDLLSLNHIIAAAPVLKELLQLNGMLLLPYRIKQHVPEEHLRMLLYSICADTIQMDLARRERPAKVRVLGNCKSGLLCKTGLEWHTDGAC